MERARSAVWCLGTAAIAATTAYWALFSTADGTNWSAAGGALVVVVAVVALIGPGLLIGSRWPAWIFGNAAGIAVVVTAALWLALYIDPGSDVNPTDWFFRGVDAGMAVLFAVLWACSSTYGAHRLRGVRD